MTTVHAGAGQALGSALEQEVGRLASRLRGLPGSRLGRPFPPHQSRAAAAHALAQSLADLAQGVTERDGTGPAWRSVPWLGPFVVADQVAVTGQDLLSALVELSTADSDPGAAPVWTRGGRAPVAEAVTALTGRLRQLRLEL
jgi:hypothetical protein